jgi:hypothetical protein
MKENKQQRSFYSILSVREQNKNRGELFTKYVNRINKNHYPHCLFYFETGFKTTGILLGQSVNERIL